MLGQKSLNRQSPVTICIMRHGMAEPYCSNDAERQLVEFGKKQVQTTSHWFRQQYPNRPIDVALVSPYVRAQQTFDTFKPGVMISQYIECADITPDGDVEQVKDYLCALLEIEQQNGKKPNTILLVSHMPFVSLLLRSLATPMGTDMFNTAAMAVIECQRNLQDGKVVHHFQGVF